MSTAATIAAPIALLVLFGLLWLEARHQDRLRAQREAEEFKAWLHAQPQFRQMVANLEAFMVTIGEALTPPLLAMAEAVNAAIPALDALNRAMQAMRDDELATVGTLYYLERAIS